MKAFNYTLNIQKIGWAFPICALEICGWNQEQSVVELDTGHKDSDHDYQESIQSTIEDQTMYRKECDSEPQDR